MTVYIRGHRFGYEIENVARLFFDDITMAQGAPRGECLEARVSEHPGGLHLLAALRQGGELLLKKSSLPADTAPKELERSLAELLFELLCSHTGKRPPWGIMTGIRPAKYALKLMQQGLSEEDTAKRFVERNLVSPQKAELALQVARYSKAAMELCSPNSYSLYVSIPFCPSRCSYCSFVSKTVGRDFAMVDDYLAKLLLELQDVKNRAERLGLKLESVYIGGGTPTVLKAEQLRVLTGELNRLFGACSTREFSVEAGRPDTITPEKLKVLKEAGVTRLSINPQTGSDEVLRIIGRSHTAADIERCFAEAREIGFDNINADLIAGLTGDTPDSFRRTLDWICGIDPENVTVHALTLKRASRMRDEGTGGASGASIMVQDAQDRLSRQGYLPYYMYKQKSTLEGLENTGFTKPGFECLYNIFIMEELHTIIACGAGGTSKLVDQKSGLINRIFNYKYPAEYISGFDNLIKRKEEMESFYHERQI